VRVDDRLIHGQVIAVWCRHLHIDRIVIVDDGVAADAFVQEVLRLAAPRDVRLQVVALAEAVPTLNADAAGRERTMILLKSPQAAAELYDGGLHFEALNIGGIGGRPGRKPVFKNIALSELEISTLRHLHDQGVRITLLTVPGEKSKPFAELLGR
jgi:PTS system mannose-specific IIB component